MARYVTLQTQDVDGNPLVQTFPDADREEVTGSTNEEYPEVAPVLIDEVVTVTKVTENKDGSKTTETYQTATGNKIPDPSGATVETGAMLTRPADPGGALNVYQGDALLKGYAAGEWKSCGGGQPSWLVNGASG